MSLSKEGGRDQARPSAHSFFTPEAVVSCLTSNAVEHVVQSIKQHSAPGSILAFDVRYKEAIEGTRINKMNGQRLRHLSKPLPTSHSPS